MNWPAITRSGWRNLSGRTARSASGSGWLTHPRSPWQAVRTSTGRKASNGPSGGCRWRSCNPTSPSGAGSRDAYHVARRILEAGRRFCPHYLGGGIGLVASAHLLAAAGGDGLLEVDCNPNPLREGLAQPFPTLVDGHLILGDAPGLGMTPVDGG